MGQGSGFRGYGLGFRGQGLGVKWLGFRSQLLATPEGVCTYQDGMQAGHALEGESVDKSS